jgi:hypothetical protein
MRKELIMRKRIFMVKVVLQIICSVLIVSGCQAHKETPAPTLSWQIEVARFEIKDSLNTVESVTQYDGSKIEVVHTQSPESGNVYLIMDVIVRKTDNQSTVPFDWQWLVVNDASGNSFHRSDNDTFIEIYQYNPRITGLGLRFGENSGWMCYEIPASAAKGKLTLSYTAEESLQEIVLQK